MKDTNRQSPAKPERPQLTVDVVIFSIRADALDVLLVERRYQPFQGRWAIPGGFVLTDESLDAAARRELEEETGVRDVYLEQLGAFGDPGRDPRGRVVTVAFYALIDSARATLVAGTDAADARWWPVADLPPLAFDHATILRAAVERLRHRLEYSAVGFQLLPPEFTLRQLQQVYEAILGRPLDKRNFRRKVEELGLVRPLKRSVQPSVGRPARLYRFAGDEEQPLRGIIPGGRL